MTIASMFVRYIVPTFATAALAACSGGGMSDSGDGMDASIDVPSCDAQIPDDAGPVPTMAQIQNIFTTSCAVSQASCHAGTSNTMTTLRLDPLNAYRDLIGVPSNEVPRLLRVDPCHPENSWLIMKLDGTFVNQTECIGDVNNAICGVRMPKPPVDFIPPSQIDMIRLWILAGAPNH